MRDGAPSRRLWGATAGGEATSGATGNGSFPAIARRCPVGKYHKTTHTFFRARRVAEL